MVSLATARWALVAAVLALASTADAKPYIHPGVHRALRAQATVDLVLTIADGIEAPLSSSLESESTSRGDKIEKLVKSLQAHATKTQGDVTAVLAQEADNLYEDVKSFWISNQVYVKGATVPLLTKLASLSSVYEIREELVLPPPSLNGAKIVEASTEASTLATYSGWGVTNIGAPTVWDEGYTGQGVVISHIDTGVRPTHVLLAGTHRTDYGWFDPENHTAVAYDSHWHGTHTMGSIVGSQSFGVAPGAQWISCKGCRRDEGCYESDLLECAQFVTCPTDTDGNNADCSKAPAVVSNSWGGGQGDTFYAGAIQTWIAAGIVPVFSIGNEGPECGTASSPGDDPTVISVGATTSADALADFSSKGAAVTGLIKPEVSAPGEDVISAYSSSDTALAYASGTSMAAPHVTGLIALLLSANSSLSYDDIRSTLYETTVRNLASTGYSCNGTTDADIPNNQFGYGRINAVDATKAVL